MLNNQNVKWKLLFTNKTRDRSSTLFFFLFPSYVKIEFLVHSIFFDKKKGNQQRKKHFHFFSALYLYYHR